MDYWQEQKQRHDRLQQQYRLDAQKLMHEAKLNNTPNDVLQKRLDVMRNTFDNNIKDINRTNLDNH